VSSRIDAGHPGQPGRVGRPVTGGQPGGDLLGLGAADLGDILIGAAVRLLDELGGVLPPQLPGQLLSGVGEVPDVGVVVVAAVPLADHGERFTAVEAGGEELHRDRDVRVQVGIAVIADRSGPVAVDSREVVVEVPAPAAARAVIFDPLAQPVPLQLAYRGFGVQDQPGDLFPAAFVVGGLVAGQPGAARGVAMFDVDGRPLAARSATCRLHCGHAQVSGG
jgi:hypothetical protein